MKSENYETHQPEHPDDDDIPVIFAVSTDKDKISFTRRDFIDIAGKIGVGAAVVGGIAASAQDETDIPCTISPISISVKIYEEPSLDAEVRGRLRRRQEFEVLEVVANDDEELWFRIEVPNASTDDNWVIVSEDIEIIGDCGEFLAAIGASSEPCVVMTANEGTVQVHVGPGRNRGVRTFLPANEEFMVIGQADDSDGELWYKVDIPTPRFSGQETWVFSEDVEASGGCAQLSAVEIPPIIPIATRPTPVPCTVTANVDSVQVHVGVGRDSGVRAYLPSNQSFRVRAVRNDTNNELWYLVDIPSPNLSGQETWVFSEDVETSGDCEQLQIAALGGINSAPSAGAAQAQSPSLPGDTPEGQTGINYTAPDGTRWTLPCGSPIPAGAVCTCNCVTVPTVTPSAESPPNNNSSSHYWYPN